MYDASGCVDRGPKHDCVGNDALDRLRLRLSAT